MLLTELSARFVSLTSETLDEEIVNAQMQIVRALELDRSTLTQLEDGERFVVTHSWQLSGLEPFPGFAVKDLPWMSSVIASGETVCFAHIDDLPEEAATGEGDRPTVWSSLERHLSAQSRREGDRCASLRDGAPGAGMAGRHRESSSALC